MFFLVTAYKSIPPTSNAFYSRETAMDCATNQGCRDMLDAGLIRAMVLLDDTGKLLACGGKEIAP